MLFRVAALMAPMVPTVAPTQTVPYDVHYAGVRVAELTTGAEAWTIRKRHPASNRWTTAVSRPQPEISGDTAFTLWGAIRDLPSRAWGIQKVDWQYTELLGWPDRNT